MNIYSKFLLATVLLMGCLACQKAEPASEEKPNIFCSIKSIKYISNTTAEVTGKVSTFVPSHMPSTVAPEDLQGLGVYYSTSAQDAETIVKEGVFVPMEYHFNNLNGGSTFVRLKNLEQGTTYYCVSSMIRKGERYVSSVESFETSNRMIPEGAVDLGMDILWASCNLGATAPEDAGDLYAWGETESKEFFGKENYRRPQMAAGGTTLTSSGHDAANRKLGRGWRMPTRFDFEKLSLFGLEHSADTVNGVAGVRFTNPHTEQSIFLPFVPVRKENTACAYDGNAYGAYLSATLSRTDYPYFGLFQENGWSLADYPFEVSYGFAIRPVFEGR